MKYTPKWSEPGHPYWHITFHQACAQSLIDAAPELLNVCRLAKAYLQGCQPPPGVDDFAALVANRCHAAIAKAEDFEPYDEANPEWASDAC
jgi:hypothetical protein